MPSLIIPPFHFVVMEGRHIHYLVFGIVILLVVGYGWRRKSAREDDSSSLLAGWLMSLLYGIGAALTRDEFAQWLNLRDVYWAKGGCASIDAWCFSDRYWR
jgi:hypothetical protein